MCKLTKEQKAALDIMMDPKAPNIILTGFAGTGKTYVLKEFISKKTAEGKTIVIVAPTGNAAYNIGGQTIHSAFQLPIAVTRPDTETVPPDTIVKSDIIVIDEISMCRADTFIHVINNIYSSLRLRPHHRRIQLVVCGDFHQIPPVVTEEEKTVIRHYFGCQITGDQFYAFQTVAWERLKFKPIFLTDIVRQKNLEFINCLNRLRVKDGTVVDDLNRMLTISDTVPDDTEVILYPTREQVRRANNERIEAIPRKEYTYKPRPSGEDPVPKDVEELRLKVGVRIRATANCTVPDDKDENGKSAFLYYNGSTGTVTECHDNYIKVRFDFSNKEVFIRYREFNQTNYYIDVSRNPKDRVKIYSRTIRYACLPVVPAYASTIHASQGATYNKIAVDPSVFTSGMLYVALTRCRTPEGITLLRPITEQDVIVSSAIIEFHKNLIPKKGGARPGSGAKKGTPSKLIRVAVDNASIFLRANKALIDGTITTDELLSFLGGRDHRDV